MFDIVDRKIKKETRSFLEWRDEFILTDENLRKSRDVIYEFEASVSQLAQMHRTPQSANHHAEGPFMTNHIENMLAGLFSICESHVSLLQIEELAREKHFENALVELEDIICENAATLKAFILLHDIAKYDVISFDAPQGSKGASEGFIKGTRLKNDVLIDRYLKLLNILKVENPDLSQHEIAIKFYDEFQIKVHYKQHAQVAVSNKYKEARQKIEDLCRLTARDREILFLLIKHHMDVILFFKDKRDGARYDYLQKVAQKSGIDSDDFLDLQISALLLDGLIGSIGYEGGCLKPNIELILNMLGSEELATDDRRKARAQRLEDKKDREFKKVLKSVGLGSEDIFKLLKIPFGVERSGVIAKVHTAVKTGDSSVLGENQKKLHLKIQEAHLLYQA